ncbi:MAG: DUF2339 domain-containing protein [Cryomorphaceae bacterium]|nr:DUF2339 domain-containing protein [Cryomorphaceae bacterium]
MDSQQKISDLKKQLEKLSEFQQHAIEELQALRENIEKLETKEKSILPEEVTPSLPKNKIVEPVEEKTVTPVEESKKQIDPPIPKQAVSELAKKYQSKTTTPDNSNIFDLETYIGENLLSKIGIVITIFGVGIGAKYSIENNLISPILRILMGYFLGGGLLTIGLILRKKYEAYGSVLVSGAMAIFYFMTYLAFDLYQLIPNSVAFTLMIIITSATVFFATRFNQEVIGLIGMVGAYAIPFLLSSKSDNHIGLFIYVSIINIGIAVVAWRKYWRLLHTSSFIFSWLIFYSWYLVDFNADRHLISSLLFLTIFYITFYVTSLGYKFQKDNAHALFDLGLFTANSFVFYGLGYIMLEAHPLGENYLGLFTLSNALLHGGVSWLILRFRAKDQRLFYFLSVLALVFLAIAIPIQFSGTFITMVWIGMAAALFWVGRVKDHFPYEQLATPIIAVAFLSFIWDSGILNGAYMQRNGQNYNYPIFNIFFLNSFIFIAAMGFIQYINGKVKTAISYPAMTLFPIIFITSIYLGIRMEIATYWQDILVNSDRWVNVDSERTFMQNRDAVQFRKLWTINFSFLFFAVMTFIGIKKSSYDLSKVGLIFTIITTLMFFYQGFPALEALKSNYFNDIRSLTYNIGVFNLLIRYICFAFVGLGLFSLWKTAKNIPDMREFVIPVDYFFHITLVALLSNELIHLLDLSGIVESSKLSLSILWTFYALVLTYLGFRQRLPHFRYIAIGLLAITLLKLFFYDISHFNTISKTIVLIAIGGMILLLSYLYNRFKQNHPS